MGMGSVHACGVPLDVCRFQDLRFCVRKLDMFVQGGSKRCRVQLTGNKLPVAASACRQQLSTTKGCNLPYVAAVQCKQQSVRHSTYNSSHAEANAMQHSRCPQLCAVLHCVLSCNLCCPAMCVCCPAGLSWLRSSARRRSGPQQQWQSRLARQQPQQRRQQQALQAGRQQHSK